MTWLHARLRQLEAWGNRLPHPNALFGLLCIGVILVSYLATALAWQVTHPTTQATITAVNLLSADGFQRLLSQCIDNFTQFAPVGPVIIVMLGLGIAEASGLLKHLLTAGVRVTPSWALSYSIVLAGILSNLAADAGYVVLIPLAGWVFQQAGRHPLAGIAAAFAGVSGGYSANLFIGPVDVILSGITTEAIQLLHPEQQVYASSNYFFIMTSTGLITLLGGWLTDRVVEPSLTPLSVTTSTDPNPISPAHQSRALRLTAITAMGLLALLLISIWPDHGWLASKADEPFSSSPFMHSLIPLIALYAGICGWVYGRATQQFMSHHAVFVAMENSLKSLAGYLVLMFFAAQFVSLFQWSQLGLMSAIQGAQWLTHMAWPAPILVLCMILVTTILNLLIGSASAKWALLAPIFIPMLALSGLAPEAVQAAYRVGDSATNIITPLMPYFGLVLAFVRQYDNQRGIGTLISMMLPFSLGFLIVWSALLIAWVSNAWPLGF